MLAAVLEASPDLVGIADPSGRVLHLNRAFSEALGRSPETEPLMIRDCHPPKALRIFEEKGLPTAARLGVWRGETEFVTWDGRSIPMSQLIVGHSDVQGSLQFYSTIMHDISERKQMEEALRLHGQELAVANAELARAARLKDEFLASMSHELRTPLNGILNISQGLAEQLYGTMNSRQQEALHDVEECGRHLLSLINDILDVAKIEAGKIEFEPGPIAVERCCRATIRLVKDSAHSKIAVGIFAGGVVFATLLPDVHLSVAGHVIDSFWIGSVLVIVLTGKSASRFETPGSALARRIWHVCSSPSSSSTLGSHAITRGLDWAWHWSSDSPRCWADIRGLTAIQAWGAVSRLSSPGSRNQERPNRKPCSRGNLAAALAERMNPQQRQV